MVVSRDSNSSWVIGIFAILWAAASGTGSLAEKSSSSTAVWRGMDQEALDAAYNQSVYAPNLEQVLGRFAGNSEVARAHLGEPLRLAYGSEANETLDVYTTAATGAPIMVFVHGGAWKLGTARDNAFAAELFVNAGAHFVVPDFSPVQDFDGDLMPMVAQLRAALVWIYENASSQFVGDPNRIYLSGFSSGGHLAATLLTSDWSSISGVPLDLIKGGLVCSGMYDLYPVSLSYRSEYVDFRKEVVEALSPIKHIDRIDSPLIVAYGSYETPEFQRQANAFADALEQQGKPVTLLSGEGYNHFEIIETLSSPYGLLGRAALDLMDLSPSLANRKR